MNLRKKLSIGLMGIGTAWLIAAGIFLVEPITCRAETAIRQLTLDASLSTPVIHRDRTQTVYLRIGLTGFDLEPAGKRAPVNLGLVIDRSGSMASENKLEKAKEAAIMVIHRLDREDIVSIVMYDSHIQVLVPATKVRDKETIIEQIRQIRPGGSTALHGGVQAGAEEMRKFLSHGRVNRMLLLSDGLANVGPSAPAELGNLGARLIRDGISVTTIGLGLGYNEDLMSQLAFRSDGSHYFAEEPQDLAKVFDQELGRALSAVAQGVTIHIRCQPGVRPVKILGRDGRIDGMEVFIPIQQIFSRHERYAIVELEVPGLSPVASQDYRFVAVVDVDYDNLATQHKDRLESRLNVSYTTSDSVVEEKTNKKVMIDVVRQIANENSERAVVLRDQGQIEEAQRVLGENASYLYMNGNKLGSEELKQYGTQNSTDASNIKDSSRWGYQRKSMRETQSINRGQR
ncbi:MAG: VWA domain-containing protein [Phycisphaerae bacterium]|nr:VWA domain-containing protein [Phycisphaerae bacterium]